MTTRIQTSSALVLAAAALLSACGGGGGGSSAPAPTPAPPPPTVTALDACASGSSTGVVARSQGVGKNVGAVLQGCVGALSAMQWTQTEGPSVKLLSDKTQAISFEAQAAGTYRFQVSFRDAAGAARSENTVVQVAAATPLLTLRSSQAVRMGGNVSVRAWPNAQVKSIRWEQIEGPTVTLNTNDQMVAIFTAPTVGRDTLIRLRATLTTTSGATDSDEVLIVVEKHDQASDKDQHAIWGGEHVSRVYAYRPTSPYAASLVPCTYDASMRDDNGCTLARLPLLAQETNGALPTVEQVMNRVVVSHDWMGVNFERFLRENDSNGDFRRMLMSTTAVVIGAHVRPSFYYALSGAIYLDADNFWLSSDERDTIDEAPDYRSDFGGTLQFSDLWRYVKNNQGISAYFDPEARYVRTQTQLLNETAGLLYHELSHALDFVPPSQYPSLDSRKSLWANIEPRWTGKLMPSHVVPARYPLTSSIMPGLGQVLFQGETATAAQKGYTATDVGGFFAADVATDTYAYSTPREDIAMTSEETLMTLRLGFQRDVAYSDKITASTTGSNLYVRWGQRGRIGSPAIKPRAKATAQLLVPWLDTTGIDALPAPIAMRAGDTWRGNLVLGFAPPPSSNDERLPTRAELGLMKKELSRLQRHQHEPRLPGQSR